MTFSVLFVCTGNVCRSPAAERLLLSRLGPASGIVPSSAGTGALVGEPISPPMAALVARSGASAENFVARQVSTAILRGADLVITMTGDHRRRTVALLPAMVQRTFVLGELAQMLHGVESREVDVLAGEGTAVDRLQALVTIAKRNRTPGVNPDDDVVDPYGRSAEVYQESFRQLSGYLDPLVRLVDRPR